MAGLTFINQARHLLILSGWRRWFFPLLCSLPYLACLLWLVSRGLVWMAEVLLAPLLMGALLAVLTLWLARQEFGVRRVRR